MFWTQVMKPNLLCLRQMHRHERMQTKMLPGCRSGQMKITKMLLPTPKMRMRVSSRPLLMLFTMQLTSWAPDELHKDIRQVACCRLGCFCSVACHFRCGAACRHHGSRHEWLIGTSVGSKLLTQQRCC